MPYTTRPISNDADFEVYLGDELITACPTRDRAERIVRERELIEEIAKLWPGHSEVNFETTSTENLLLLIRDALQAEL